MNLIKNKITYAVLFIIIALTFAVGLQTVKADNSANNSVYQIDAKWITQEEQVTGKDQVRAEYNVSVNDANAASQNENVDNIVVTFTTEGGRFASLPEACETVDVNPISSISADGKELTCNVGTHKQGTAFKVLVTLVPTTSDNKQLTLNGSVGKESAALPPKTVIDDFFMDVQFGTPSGIRDIYRSAGYINMPLEFSIVWGNASVQGPDSVSYNLTVDPAIGTLGVASQADINAPSGSVGCTPNINGETTMHPFSGTTSRPKNQIAPYAQTCTLENISGNQYKLTITGLDYSLTQVPTESSDGSALSPQNSVIMAGQLWFKIQFDLTKNNSINLTSDQPTYTAVNGQESNGSANYKTSSKAYVAPGGFSNRFYRPDTIINGVVTPAGGTSWDDSLRVGQKAVLESMTITELQPSSTELNGICNVIDTKYMELASTGSPELGNNPSISMYEDFYGSPRQRIDLDDGFSQNGIKIPSIVVSYYTGNGNDNTLNPNSPNYDIRKFDCNDTDNWTTTLPSNIASVKAVKVMYNIADLQPNFKNFLFNTYQVVKADAPIGQDIWSVGIPYVGDKFTPTSGWANPTTPVKGESRYPATTSVSDAARIVSNSPLINKSVNTDVILPGVPVTYTLEYAATNNMGLNDLVDDFIIVDTLPKGVNYIVGSADPAPQISTVNGSQVLTWTMNGLEPNKTYSLTYQVETNDDFTVGTTFVNNVSSTINLKGWPSGVDLPVSNSSASVTSVNEGYTAISKTSNVDKIPNVNNDGVGEGSWTVLLKSYNTAVSNFTDTIDVLPYNGDGRGTKFSGSYELVSVTPKQNQNIEIYYTKADPATISDEPNNPMNGKAGDVTGNTLDWTTEFTKDATAIRIINKNPLNFGDSQSFEVAIKTNGFKGGDVVVNRAQAVAENTALLMRSSDAMTMGDEYSASLKKYVKDSKGEWHDANDSIDYPTFNHGATIDYKIVVKNTGNKTLENIVVEDDKQPKLGSFTIDKLEPGEEYVHEYSIKLTNDYELGHLVNTACATADKAEGETEAPDINCDPAGIVIEKTPEVPGEPEGPGVVNPTLPTTGSNTMFYVLALVMGSVSVAGYRLATRSTK